MKTFENLRKEQLNEMDSRQYALIKAGLVAPNQLATLKAALTSLNRHGDMRKLNPSQQKLVLQYMNSLTSAVLDDNGSYSSTKRSVYNQQNQVMEDVDYSAAAQVARMEWINQFFKHVHTLSHGKFGGEKGQKVDPLDVAHLYDKVNPHKAAEYFLRKKLNEASETALEPLSESTAPAVLTLRRTGIRAFPDGQEVALYKNDQLGMTFAVPLSGGQSGLINGIKEALDPSMGSSAYVKDFVHSKNPKFEGKSKEKRIQMALAAYYEDKKKQ